MSAIKYSIIGSEAQVAATESHASLMKCRHAFRKAKFSNGIAALEVIGGLSQDEAARWLNRSLLALAYVSGRLGKWWTPTFAIVKTSEVAK